MGEAGYSAKQPGSRVCALNPGVLYVATITEGILYATPDPRHRDQREKNYSWDLESSACRYESAPQLHWSFERFLLTGKSFPQLSVTRRAIKQKHCSPRRSWHSGALDSELEQRLLQSAPHQMLTHKLVASSPW